MTQGKVICRECKFFNRFDDTCRRFPPVVVVGFSTSPMQGDEYDRQYDHISRFPTVNADWWCGKAEANEP